MHQYWCPASIVDACWDPCYTASVHCRNNIFTLGRPNDYEFNIPIDSDNLTQNVSVFAPDRTQFRSQHTLHSTQHTAHSTKHTARFTLHTAHCTPHTTHNTLYSLHNTTIHKVWPRSNHWAPSSAGFCRAVMEIKEKSSDADGGGRFLGLFIKTKFYIAWYHIIPNVVFTIFWN